MEWVVTCGALGAALVVAVVAGIWWRLKGARNQGMPQVERRDVKGGNEVEEVIRLYLAPEAEERALPSLKDHTAVPMRGHNLLPAYINGRYCEIFVDCGTSSAIVKYQRAKRLGLLSQVTRFRLIQVRMWTSWTVAKMLVVEEVAVELAGGVSFPCTFLVAPREGPINHLKHDIFLDNATLRRTRAMQSFSHSVATLFFPKGMPELRPRTSPDSQYVLDNARFKDCAKYVKLNVLLDTGAQVFYASRQYHRPHRSIEVVVAKDSLLYWKSLMAVPSSNFDFVMGVSPLAKYCSLLDYSNQYLYLCIDNRVYRARLRRTITL
ncbi:hypothetical protein E2C01_069806 [Portunus trituberculatus]|uniref:Peptidase A2 domain-containing protein n=1 Tax=Portunus trituberculatus TaxID=210409 RepID=A0A5B7I0I8_PORTR|nr:hypothetical protein [Portunus trituberculatus]